MTIFLSRHYGCRNGQIKLVCEDSRLRDHYVAKTLYWKIIVLQRPFNNKWSKQEIPDRAWSKHCSNLLRLVFSLENNSR